MKKNLLMFCLTILLVFSFSFPCFGAGLNVRALIDGKSQLKIQGNNVWWHHIEHAAPGRHGGADEPTYLNSVAWYPWPDPAPADYPSCNCDSLIYTHLSPALSTDGVAIQLSAATARNPVSIIQQPSGANSYTAIIEFNDTDSGSAWYEINVTYSGAASIAKTVDFSPGGDTPPIGIMNPGDEIQYTINYNFTVPVDDTIVRIIDNFDSNLDLVDRESAPNFSNTLFDSTTNTLTWQKSPPSYLNAGTYSGTVTFRATIKDGLIAGTEIKNQVCLSMELPAGAGSNPQDVCDDVTFTTGEHGKPQPIPTLSEWGMIIMSLILAGSAIWMIRRRQVA